MRYPRLKITKQFDLGGLRYIVGAVVSVSEPTARKWIEDGQAELYPGEAPLAPAPEAPAATTTEPPPATA